MISCVSMEPRNSNFHRHLDDSMVRALAIVKVIITIFSNRFSARIFTIAQLAPTRAAKKSFPGAVRILKLICQFF